MCPQQFLYNINKNHMVILKKILKKPHGSFWKVGETGDKSNSTPSFFPCRSWIVFSRIKPCVKQVNHFSIPQVTFLSFDIFVTIKKRK